MRARDTAAMGECCNRGSFAQATAARSAAASRETVLDVEGASCGGCAARIESAVRALPGVARATFDLAARRVRVEHAPVVEVEALRAAIARAGYRARLPAHARDAHRDSRIALLRTGVAGLAMMQVMMFAFPVYVAGEGTLSWDQERLFALASLALTIPVMVFSAAPIWRAAWAALRARHVSMDVTVALGIGSAFLASLPATAWGGPVYYEAVTMFVFFLSAGRYFEARALAATLDAGEALEQLLPAQAQRITAGGREKVLPAALRPGERVWIAAGEAAPADCVLEAGAADFNEALLTGESAPAAKRPGDAVLAGSVNLSAPVEARVERVGEQQTLSRARRLVERAAGEKPLAAQLADRVAAHFVVAVVLLAAAAAAWWLAVDPPRALPVVVAVLVVSCPCALSLATPVARAACAGALARDGVLVTRGRAIEALAAVNRVVFDKTGTLTTGRMRIAGLDTLGELDASRCLAIAAALAEAMPHPVAHALAAASTARAAPATGLKPVAGAGVEGCVAGERYRVGSAAFCAQIAGSPPPFALDGEAPHAALAATGRWLAVMRFDDTLRGEAAQAVRRLRALGVEPSLVSGDRAAVVARVAGATGIESATHGAAPAEKLRILKGLADAGDTVAMVGDGVNDAPALAAAHVGIAVGGAAAAARSQADLVLVNPSLLAIAGAIETARRCRRIVAQNLAWAAAYNAVTLPLALTGHLAPWMASLGMSLSSLFVVANALRLARRTAAGAVRLSSSSARHPA